MITNSLDIEEEIIVLGKRKSLVAGSGGGVLVDIWETPFWLFRKVTEGLFAELAIGLFEDSFSGVFTIAPFLFAELLESFYIPVLRVSAVWFGFYVVPPHVLLPVSEGPSGTASHGAGLATDTTIDVKDGPELPFGPGVLVGVLHFPFQVPVEYFGHYYAPSANPPAMYCFMVLFS